MVTYYMSPFLSCSGKQQQNKDNEKISGCQELGVRVRFDYKRTARGKVEFKTAVSDFKVKGGVQSSGILWQQPQYAETVLGSCFILKSSLFLLT